MNKRYKHNRSETRQIDCFSWIFLVDTIHSEKNVVSFCSAYI